MKGEKELRIVRIESNLKQGKYLSTDVFTEEEIIVKLRGKLRMVLTENLTGKTIYVALNEFDDNYARYIYSWRDLDLLTPQNDFRDQKVILDSKFDLLKNSKELTYPEILGF